MNRKDLLEALRIASIGLSKTGLIEQSDHFIIRKGKIIAHNDEICVRVSFPDLGDFSGAVPGQLLLKAVTAFPDNEITISIKNDPQLELVIKGISRPAGVGIRCSDAKLSISDVPKSGEWFDLPDWFVESLVEASRCCANDQLSGVSTCVHIDKSVIESCDNSRLYLRGDVTGFPSSFFMHCSAASQFSGMVFKSASLSSGWCHFRVDGAQISVRGREFDKFPDLSKVIKFEGSSIQLPASLSDAASRCSLMSDGDANLSLVKLQIDSKVIKVSARGLSGWYREKIALDGSGMSLTDTVTFSINPLSLSQILKRKAPVTIGDSRMRVAISGGFYCCVLQQVDSE